MIALNKWDLIEKDTFTIEKYRKRLETDLAFMDYFVSVAISAKTGQRLNKLMQLVKEVYISSNFKVTTGVLNDVIADAVATVEPPSKNGRQLKIKYATQVSTAPPVFLLFVNDEKLMHFSYKRYLVNSLRKAFDLKGTPIRIIVRSKEE